MATSVDLTEPTEGTVDATETITCYEKGKTWKCPECDQGLGTDHNKRIILCSCGERLEDRKAHLREPVEHDRSPQTNLEQWL